VVRALLFAAPLALDTFAVSAAIGMAGLPERDRLRLSVVFAAFEMAMPLVGFLIGRAVGGAVGSFADGGAIAILVAVGVLMLRGEEDEAAIAGAAGRVHGAAIIGLGLSISLDELAVGLSLGLLGLPVLLAILVLGAQAFAAAQLGQRLGARVGARVAEGAERVAGAGLILLGAGLALEHLR
jgi:putative Mn2+ efflux pump MntP